MKTEFSLQCELCPCYNIQEGIIINGLIYCWNCIKKSTYKELLKGIKKEVRNGRAE